MNWISVAAIYFIIWWVTLFAMLPISLKTQDDDGGATLGTTSSAPRGPHMARAFLRTTIVSLIICGTFYGVTLGLGLKIDDIPSFSPDFN